MNEEKTVWKFWSLMNLDKAKQISSWLEEQSRNGWHLKKVSMRMQRFTFGKAEPARIAYAIDFEGTLNPDYRNFVKDSRWELVSKHETAYLWKKSYDVGDQKPEFFSNNEHLVTKTRRLIIAMSVIAYALGTLIINLHHGVLAESTIINNGILILLTLIEGTIIFRIIQLALRRRRQIKNIY